MWKSLNFLQEQSATVRANKEDIVGYMGEEGVEQALWALHKNK